MRLALRLDHGDGETPSDFASRLSVCNCRDDLWKFCGDFGIPPQGLVDGVPEAVSALAELAGVDAAALLYEALVRDGRARRCVHKGERLLWSSLTRTRVRMCPACMAEDVGRLDVRMSARPHRRSMWIIRNVRTCDRHGMGLVEIGASVKPTDMHDTSRIVAAALSHLERLIDDAPRRAASGFERYVSGRLSGGGADSWLDGLPLYAALHLSFVVGAVARHGPRVLLDELDDDEAWRSEAAGFEIVDRGPVGVRSLLDELQASFRESRSAKGPKVMYGRLYDWLAHECDDAAYDPVRDVIVEHSLDTLALGPGDVLFGREIASRRVHSVWSASKEFGLHPKRMRKMLRRANLTAPGTDGLPSNKVTFDAEEGESFLRDLAETMSLECVRDYLNVPRPHDRGLFERGLIRPMIRGARSRGDHGFLRRDLDDLLARLLRNADPACADDPDFAPLIHAAKHSCRAVMDVVELVLDGKLERVGVDPSERGFLSVLVNVKEVRSIVAGDGHDGFTLKEIEQELRTTTYAVKSLVQEGYLSHRTVKNPVTGWMQPIVPREELERFRRQYVTLSALSRERGEHLQRMKKKLVAAGVAPVADPKELNVTLYRRADLP